ncbi:glycosyltransferase [Acidimicrobiaceae bacterium]|nr:glycosyltransferase [Acidimicrobiaceae bacterium]
MKVYLSKINESWIVDRMRKEWYENNPDLSTEKIKESDIIWIISPWLWKKIPKRYLKKNKVVCSIYHFEKKDFNRDNLKDFYKRDKYVDEYHVISPYIEKDLRNLTMKPITYIPFWLNESIWFDIQDKSSLRKKFKIDEESYLIGSFQRDTEGSDLKSPKLIKGPDRFIEIVKSKKENIENLKIVLTGKRRQYVINELEKLDIDYIYFEMASFEELNELYNMLDLYIVSSRIEGGPQAIVECGITKTPIISTDVGFASDILSTESIFDMNNFKDAIPNIEYAYEKSSELTIPKGFEKFLNLIFSK